MSVSTSNYTSTGISGIITISNELSSTNIISAVNNFITSNGTGNRGWTLYDTLEGNEPGTGVSGNVHSPINTYVFRSQNADTTTYKYLIMRWDIIKRWLWTSTCESWDNTTSHTPSNECWTNNSAFIHGYDLIDGKIFLSIAPRHAVIWTFISSSPGLWSMVCEFERDAAENTAGAGYPCWAWTCSLMLGTPFAKGPTEGPSKIIFAFPRLSDNSTGRLAASKVKTGTIRGAFPPDLLYGTALSIVDHVPYNYLHLGSAFYGINGRDERYSTSFYQSTLVAGNTQTLTNGTTTRNMIVGQPVIKISGVGQFNSAPTIASITSDTGYTLNNAISVIGAITFVVQRPPGELATWDTLEVFAKFESTADERSYGRIYDVGVTGPSRTILPIFYENLNNSGGWPDRLGSVSPVVALPFNGGNEGLRSSYSSNITSHYITVADSLHEVAPIGGGRLLAAGSKGLYLCYADQGPFGVIGLTNPQASTQTPITIISDTNGIVDVVFDGEKYAYCSTSTGVTRIDVSGANPTSWSTSSISLSQGGGYISIDKAYVYISGRVPQASANRPHVYIINRSTFTEATSFTTGTDPAGAVLFGTVQPTYTGYGIVMQSGAAGTTTSRFLQRFSSSTGAQINTTEVQASNTVQDPYGFWLDVISGTIYAMKFSYTASGTIPVYTLSYGAGISNIGLTSIGNITISVLASIGYYPMAGTGAAAARGDVFILPEFGTFKAHAKSPQNANTHTLNIFNLSNDPVNGTGPFLLKTTASGASQGVDTIPHGGSTNRETDGVFSYSILYQSATSSRIYILRDGYDVTLPAWVYSIPGNFSSQTGSLLVKS